MPAGERMSNTSPGGCSPTTPPATTTASPPARRSWSRSSSAAAPGAGRHGSSAATGRRSSGSSPACTSGGIRRGPRPRRRAGHRRPRSGHVRDQRPHRVDPRQGDTFPTVRANAAGRLLCRPRGRGSACRAGRPRSRRPSGSTRGPARRAARPAPLSEGHLIGPGPAPTACNDASDTTTRPPGQ